MCLSARRSPIKTLRHTLTVCLGAAQRLGANLQTFIKALRGTRRGIIQPTRTCSSAWTRARVESAGGARKVLIRACSNAALILRLGTLDCYRTNFDWDFQQTNVDWDCEDRDRDRDKGTETETETETQTQTQRQRQRHRGTEAQRHRHRDTETETQNDREREKGETLTPMGVLIRPFRRPSLFFGDASGGCSGGYLDEAFAGAIVRGAGGSGRVVVRSIEVDRRGVLIGLEPLGCCLSGALALVVRTSASTLFSSESATWCMMCQRNQCHALNPIELD
eukprot:620203-Rhodomonas_salina.3